MSHLFGKFTWFHLLTRDVKRATAFYGELFTWKIAGVPMGPTLYEMIQVAGTGIGGFVPLDAKDPRPAHWQPYVSVADVDAAAAVAKAAGGKVTVAPSDIPTVGRRAEILDPQGAELVLFRHLTGDTDHAGGPGHFFWNELWATDDVAAVAFYEKLCGYSHKDMDMGPQGTYRVLEKDGVSRGGVMKAPPGVPAMWLPYVTVDDCDATTARAQRLGAKVHLAPQDIPGIGRFSVFANDQGATIAVIKPAPR